MFLECLRVVAAVLRIVGRRVARFVVGAGVITSSMISCKGRSPNLQNIAVNRSRLNDNTRLCMVHMNKRE
jgi:hypothetical protein